MKGILVILDGVGDLPNKQLDNKTPLEVANTPNLDFLASRGELGYMYPVNPGFIPESDEAIVSIFGNNLIESTRGQLEARGTDIKLTRGDLAFRTNFATIDSIEKGNILDRRAGRTLTTKEAEILAKSLNKIKLSSKFKFISTIQHRGVLVFNGGFSDNILGNDSTYTQGKSKDLNKIGFSKALDDEENTQYSVNIVNEFIERAHEILETHPINEERKKKGLMPANYLLLRGAGIEPPKLKIYKKWLSVCYMPLEIGFSKVSGMKTFSFDYPKLKNLDAYSNLYDGLKKVCKFTIKTLKKNKGEDYAYIHIKETDLPGHDNKPIEKKLMIEYIDKTLFYFLRKFATSNKIKVVVTADHSTPCKLKNHSADPVPVLLYNDSVIKEKKFCEKEARLGSLGRIIGKDLLRKVGFVK
ncbi:phosphoglycerate mutase [Candidatus Pacearchaeota archaeon]|nr:phosphoglycerate mutase [Candidatus Pacearchaeota archaeon]|tara:strand:+ start:265 stop:1503 length:1239 start_codon:yes stop_codon:yes gene_type:complete